MLDRFYGDMQLGMKRELGEHSKQGGMVMVATDSWKRRIAAGGAPLMNVLLLMSEGGSRFYDVLDVSGSVKDAQWVADTHIGIAEKLSPGSPNKVCRVCNQVVCLSICILIFLQQVSHTCASFLSF